MLLTKSQSSSRTPTLVREGLINSVICHSDPDFSWRGMRLDLRLWRLAELIASPNVFSFIADLMEVRLAVILTLVTRPKKPIAP